MPLHNPQLHSDPAAAYRAADTDSLIACPSGAEGPFHLETPKDRPSPLQVAMLGCGQPWQEQALSCLSSAFPGSAAGVPHHYEALAHLLMAGSDFLVVPSRYEPCGLVALCALRYGTVPVVAPVGGLLDISRGGGAALGVPQSPTASLGARGDAGTLGYVLRAPMGAAGDTARSRQDVAVLVSGILSASVDFYRSVASVPGPRVGGRGQVHGGASTLSTGTFFEKRDRCMEADVSWDSATSEWEATLTSLLEDASG